MICNPQLSLLALVYAPGHGAAADALLATVADELKGRGFRLGGTVQEPAERAALHACDLIGHDLGTGTRLRLSVNRGREAKGCRLDCSVLEALAGMAAHSLETGVDAFIVSRFGKREQQGAGFRAALATAVAAAVPVLVTVNKEHLSGWRAFADGVGFEAPATLEAVQRWVRHVIATGARPSIVCC